MMQVALITGGGRGIGLGIARALAAEGCHLAIGGVRPEAQVREALDELRALGVDVLYCRGDIADREARADVIERIRAHYGQLNVLVNNAGVAPTVRADILALGEPLERYAQRTGPLQVLVVGGSLGAQALNETLPLALAKLPVEQRPTVGHQAGRGKEEATRKAYADAGVEAWVVEFIDDMADAYAWADLVVCRSGALTVSELAAAGVAALLVPYPHAVDDHQTANGNYLAREGAAIMIQQRDLGPDRLANELRSLDRKKVTRMAVTARSLAKPDATGRFADICEEVLAA